MFVYAVNIHTGGGKILLDALLTDQPFGPIKKLYVDSRYQLPIDCSISCVKIKRGFFSRLFAEIKMYRDEDFLKIDKVLFFGNLPPAFRSFFSQTANKEFILYLQNAFLIVGFFYPKNSLKEFVRLSLERVWLLTFKNFVDEIWVQTPWMKKQSQNDLHFKKTISIKPFLPKFPQIHSSPHARLYQFLYVGSFSKHKRLDLFIDALKKLNAQIRDRIKVVIILDGSENHRKTTFETLKTFKNIDADVFHHLSRQKLFEIYQQSKFLVCTSDIESFYLQLYEAQTYGCQIIAPQNANYLQGLDLQYHPYPLNNLDLSPFLN